MPVIKVLPPELVNKIAAGEVVERPASVVKELLDNAFDAHAVNITVEIEDAGAKKILIHDNGIGMDREDAINAFTLHATSKIKSEEDLFNITHFGFRGEALASIAAVSKITLKTRRNHDPLGTEVKLEGGQLMSVEDVGCPIGTSILVEDLFFNVPARREFLKQPQSEYRAILEIINAHMMANPQVGLQFINNGKVVYSLPKDDQLEDRIKEVIGKDAYDQTVGLFYEHPHLEIYGVVGKPQIATERVKNQFIFVNKRRVFDKTISAAVREAFQTLMPKNFYPQFVIFIDVPRNIVDVNVHPRKEEIRFSNGQLIFTGIKEAVSKAIERNNLTPGAATDANAPKDDPFADPFASPFNKPNPMPGMPPRNPQQISTNPFLNDRKPMQPGFPSSNPYANKPSPFGNKPMPTMPNMPKAPNFGGGINSVPPFPSSNPFASKPSPFNKDMNSPFNDDLFSDADLFNDNDDLAKPMQPQGGNNKFLQVKNLYIITEGPDGLVVYDQHAVHERINYEKLLAIYEQGKNSNNTQKLLTPLILNFSAKDYSILVENLDEIKKTGFELEDFGGNSIKITEVPQIFAQMDISQIINELILDLESDNKIKDVDSASHKALTYLACRSSIKANDRLDPLEISNLLNKLETAQIKYTCPHGRPLKIEFTFNELEKLFKRTGF
ncbi:MAG: DNA mismatch repair endonuclease MutL [Niabella sp.]|nr:MAG: DNA mismatch repair endonuclease MutL [Niabella sp.]